MKAVVKAEAPDRDGMIRYSAGIGINFRLTEDLKPEVRDVILIGLLNRAQRDLEEVTEVEIREKDGPSESTAVPSPNQASSQPRSIETSMDPTTNDRIEFDRVREWLGMEKLAFEKKALTDAPFHALCVVFARREIDHRIEMEKVHRQAMRLMSTPIFMEDARFANAIVEIVRLADPTEGWKAPF